MNRRVAILTILLTSFVFFAPPVSAASRFQIRLPDCERTIYTLQNQHVKNSTPQSMSPDEYEAKVASDASFKETWTITDVTTSGDCTFEDFFQLFANLSTWGLSLLGAVAVFFFIWGGFTLLISGGRSEKVEEGKKILSGTFLGVLVVLTAWIVVNAYIGGFAGGSFIFPNSPFRRSGLGATKKECRAKFSTQYSQTGCTGNDLHFGCADPTSSDGAVTKLQSVLAQKCPAAGAADGCLGKNTAYALWGFLASNGYQPLPANYRDVRISAATIQRLLTDPSSRDCSDTFTIVPSGDPGNPADQPPASGCCVPSSSSSNLSCVQAAGAADCPIGTDYSFQAFTCGTFPQCTGTTTSGCCVKYQTTKGCQVCAQDHCTTAGAIWQQGTCIFAPGQCQAAILCS